MLFIFTWMGRALSTSSSRHAVSSLVIGATFSPSSKHIIESSVPEFSEYGTRTYGGSEVVGSTNYQPSVGGTEGRPLVVPILSVTFLAIPFFCLWTNAISCIVGGFLRGPPQQAAHGSIRQAETRNRQPKLMSVFKVPSTFPHPHFLFLPQDIAVSYSYHPKLSVCICFCRAVIGNTDWGLKHEAMKSWEHSREYMSPM